MFDHGRRGRSRSRATPSRSGRIPTHESERRHRLSLPAARAVHPRHPGRSRSLVVTTIAFIVRLPVSQWVPSASGWTERARPSMFVRCSAPSACARRSASGQALGALPDLEVAHLPQRPDLLRLGQRVPVGLRLPLPLGTARRPLRFAAEAEYEGRMVHFSAFWALENGLVEPCARHDSNVRPLPPQGSALSPELRARFSSWERPRARVAHLAALFPCA